MKHIHASVRLAAALLSTAALLALSACGSRTYSATVAGYVKSSTVNTDGTQDGINGATVYVYTVDPGTDATAEALARTSTMTSGGNDGYWSHKIMWTTTSPLFGDEGDSGTVWVKVMRKGYFPKTAQVAGILSDSSNVVPTIEMDAIYTTELKGKVVNENGVGVDGVAVVLDLMSTTDTKADYTATTATTDGELGVFTFSDVAWGDADSIPADKAAAILALRGRLKAASARAITTDGTTTTATETCKLYVDDTAYYSDAYNEEDRDSQTAFTITSGVDSDIRTAQPITVRSTTFTVPIVKGRVVDSSGAGVNGVTIALDLPITTDTTPDATVTTATLGSDGWYQFENVSWTDSNPTHSASGTYDDKVTANVYLDDGTRYSANDSDNPISITVTSGASSTVSSNIVVGSAEFTMSTVKGKVVLKGTSTGQNGVTVYLELSDASTVNTTTTTIDGTDGIFKFSNVEWTDTEPEASSGVLDTEQVRIYVQDDDYSSDNDVDSPLIVTLSDTGASDSTDATGTPLSVQMLNFTCPSVTGKVAMTTTSGTGVSGITVVLDLQSTSDTTQDYTTTTDSNGVFLFTNVEWSDETPDSATGDTEDIQISVSDTDYSVVTAMALKTVTAGTAAGSSSDTGWTIAVTRKTRPEYSVTVTGYCRYTNTTTGDYTDISGVTVVINENDADAGLITNANNYTVKTGSDGTYTATITWSRDTSYVPGSQGDELDVTVTFSDSSYVWYNSPVTTSILSWQDNPINGTSKAMQ